MVYCTQEKKTTDFMANPSWQILEVIAKDEIWPVT